MGGCSVAKKIEIVKGGRDDYESLARYHYRGERLGAFASIYALRADRFLKAKSGIATVGVIVYTMPAVAVAMRNVALGGVLGGLDRGTRLDVINKNIRCVSRVIIEPRFRGLGLAVQLVSETIRLMNMPVIEALAVMGKVNPFFAKAGMRAYEGPEPLRCVQLVEAFSMVGVERQEFIEPVSVYAKLEGLDKRKRSFIEKQIGEFLQSYGKRKYMSDSAERIRYVLSRLTERPVYYIWRNENLEMRI